MTSAPNLPKRQTREMSDVTTSFTRLDINSIPAQLVRQIVLLIADGGVESTENAARAIEAFSQASRLTRDVTMGMWAYVMSLAPVRALPTSLMLRWISPSGARSRPGAAESSSLGRMLATELEKTARESQSSALMPRIAALAASPHGAFVAAALHAKLVASLNRATVNGEPMYGDEHTTVEALATEIIRRLGGGHAFRKMARVSHANVRGFRDRITSFLRSSRAGRTRHALTYGPMCIWDVSHIENFSVACCASTAVPKSRDGVTFNSDLYWDTSAATDMSDMFRDNGEFKGDLGTWDVSKVTTMTGMFKRAGITDSGIGSWDVGALQNAKKMFGSAPNLSRTLDLSRWNIGECTQLRKMFAGSSVHDSGIGKWTLHPDATANYMFRYTQFRGNLENWSDKHRKEASWGLHAGAPAETQSAQSAHRAPSKFGDPANYDQRIIAMFDDSFRRTPEKAWCVVQ
jgi:surface protein